MTFVEYEKALSKPRIGKYLSACGGDKNKALILYRYNIKLCQKFYGWLGVLEVVLRNAVDDHFKEQLGDSDWLVTQATSGFLVNYQTKIFDEYTNLLRDGRYNHDRLVSSLSLGVWVFMFSKACYRNSGQTLLRIFPNKTPGLGQSEIHKELHRIRSFRNRIAHHESLCFDRTGGVGVEYVQEIFSLITKYIGFLGYNAGELLFGVDSPLPTIEKVDKLISSI
jgi:hypothetical protein